MQKKLCKICNIFLYVGFPFFCNGYLRPLNMTPPQTRRLCCVYNTKHLLHVRLSTPARHRTFATCQQSRTKKCDLSSFFFSWPTSENGFCQEFAMSETRPYKAQKVCTFSKPPPSARAPPAPGRSPDAAKPPPSARAPPAPGRSPDAGVPSADWSQMMIVAV